MKEFHKNMHGGYVKYSLTFGCVLRWEMVVKVTGHQHLRLHHIQKVQWIYHMLTLGRSSSQMHIVVKYLSCSRGVRIVRKSNLNPNPERVKIQIRVFNIEERDRICGMFDSGSEIKSSRKISRERFEFVECSWSGSWIFKRTVYGFLLVSCVQNSIWIR